MAKISILPDVLCNQIAAGEVVERPAAVVKELVENSIDAQSSKIMVSLLDGGRREIRVVDNGCGMSPEDALLSLERHATSKIRSSEDLDCISSLGFRGEAIPSIAAVSRFELTTREEEAIAGTSIRIEAGVIKDVREKGCPVGTQVLVRDLFYCVPARRKFLRTAETELSYITDQFMRISLANHQIHMQLFSQERVVCDHPRCDGLIIRAGQVLGAEIARSLSPVEFEKNGVSISGFLAPPDIQRTNSQSLFLYVNGRPVWDRLLQRAVLTAYEALIPRGKFPVAVLFVGISPGLVDVNVHPAKREIRFRNPGETISILRDALFNALAALRPKTAGFSRPEALQYVQSQRAQPPLAARESQAAFPFRSTRRSGLSESPKFRFYTPDDEKPAGESPSGVVPPDVVPPDEASVPEQPSQTPPPDQFEAAEFAYSNLNLIGQLANTFILLEAPDGLVLIDQHAAHERIVFNSLSKRRKTAGQRLTRPVVVDLLPKEAVLLKSLTAGLSELGFEIEPFGGSSFAIHAVPAPLMEFKPEDILRDYLRYAEDECHTTQGEILTGLARVASCHGSVRAGQRLKNDEIKRLLELLDSADSPFTCPHGRPLSYKLTYEQIFRFFKRS